MPWPLPTIPNPYGAPVVGPPGPPGPPGAPGTDGAYAAAVKSSVTAAPDAVQTAILPLSITPTKTGSVIVLAGQASVTGTGSATPPALDACVFLLTQAGLPIPLVQARATGLGVAFPGGGEALAGSVFAVVAAGPVGVPMAFALEVFPSNTAGGVVSNPSAQLVALEWGGV